MEILVCMKQVPDDSIEIKLGADGLPDLSKAEPQGNAFDTYAQELAVRYIEANGGTVSILSLGPADNETCLKSALAVGAEKAYRVSDEGFEDADAFVTANLLAAAIKKIEADNGAAFDLVLCGRESTDYIGGEVAEYLAEKTARPFVTNVVEIVQENADAIQAKKELDSGYYWVDTPLPAVMTISKPDYDPRYPKIKDKMAARKKEVPVITAADLTLEDSDKVALVKYLGFQEPPKREAGVKIQEEEPADAVAKMFEILAADKVL